jgi:hypothetical protein
MITRSYAKQCDAGRLAKEIVDSGKPVSPSENARFYGVNVEQLVGEGWQTSILLFDDITEVETTAIDALVAAHIALPLVEDPVYAKTEDGRLWVRAESRPADCTTLFTGIGDNGGIGDGKVLTWNFADTTNDITAPTGFRKKRLEFHFKDSVYVKDGLLIHSGAPYGSFVDGMIVCPTGFYYYDNNAAPQLASVDTPIAHYISHVNMFGDCCTPFIPESCSVAIPATYKFWIDVTTLDTDTTSVGSAMLTLYRKRTVIL